MCCRATTPAKGIAIRNQSGNEFLYVDQTHLAIRRHDKTFGKWIHRANVLASMVVGQHTEVNVVPPHVRRVLGSRARPGLAKIASYEPNDSLGIEWRECSSTKVNSSDTKCHYLDGAGGFVMGADGATTLLPGYSSGRRR